MSIPRTPLDAWIARELDSSPRLENRQRLEEAQKRSLALLISQAREKTRFYRKHFQGYSGASLEDLPFTFPSDLQKGDSPFLGVSRSEIQRMVSLATSGTRGSSKRLGFTREELERTEEFFLVGMSTFTPRESRVGIFMEGPRPYSIGDLLKRALERMDCAPHLFGLIRNVPEAAAWMEKIQPQVVAGLPSQMLSLAEATPHTSLAPKAVLLSADMAPQALRKRIERAWNCETFNHYGLTESGWGCAVECGAHRGCHIRELDLLMEIVDSQGKILPKDTWGEVVLTTLRRPSFPLIRYRTGDRGRFLSGVCPCGSPLKRLEVTGRLPLEGASETPLDLYEVENTLWSFEEIRDFSLSLEYQGGSPAALTALLGSSPTGKLPLERIQKALEDSSEIPLRIHLKKHPEPFLKHKHPKRNWRCYS